MFIGPLELPLPLLLNEVTLGVTLGYDLDVVRVAAETFSAHLVGDLIIGEWSHECFVVEAVCVLSLTLVVAGDSVTGAFGDWSLPQPTAGFRIYGVLVGDEAVVTALKSVAAGIRGAERFAAPARTN